MSEDVLGTCATQEGGVGWSYRCRYLGQTTLKVVAVSEVTQREHSDKTGERRTSLSVPGVMGQVARNGCRRRLRRAARGQVKGVRVTKGEGLSNPQGSLL